MKTQGIIRIDPRGPELPVRLTLNLRQIAGSLFLVHKKLNGNVATVDGLGEVRDGQLCSIEILVEPE